ncbi:MAG: hypothetical protein ABIQ39_08695 [Ilumatobacteraceae bacterium]
MFWPDSPRDCVQISGPDATTFLHSQMSQDIVALAVGDNAWSFLLQPNGRVDVLTLVHHVAADSFVIHTDVGYVDALTARLNRFKIRVSAELALVQQPPPGGIAGASTAELEDARIAACWPAMGAEIVPGETIPAETGILDVTVSFTKGCYPGQELVERMDSRAAQAPRHLIVVGRRPGDVVGGDLKLVAGGTGTAASDAVVGTITSVGTTQVLALVRRGVEAFDRG